jgi:tRNA (guanine37-N1)-methyltransferase
MRFDVLTLFPGMFDSVFGESIVRRALDAGQVELHLHNIRDYAHDKHHVTDDLPFGGGGGMVMKVEPIMLALESLLDAELIAAQKRTGQAQTPIILLTPAGQRFSHDTALALGRYERLVLICGRYEGIDERVVELAVTHELSLGDFVLSGGEIAAMAVIEAVTRLIPGVLGDMRAIVDDSHARGLLECPHYTRPAEFRGLPVPPMLLSGNHALVARWRRQQALVRTLQRRPDLMANAELSASDRALLDAVSAESVPCARHSEGGAT